MRQVISTEVLVKAADFDSSAAQTGPFLRAWLRQDPLSIASGSESIFLDYSGRLVVMHYKSIKIDKEAETLR
jgi:hypothetical protein